jgi:hypothetical protein
MLGTVALVYLQWQRLLNKLTMAGLAAVVSIIALVLAKLDLFSFAFAAIGGVMTAITTAILFRLTYRLLSGFNK